MIFVHELKKIVNFVVYFFRNRIMALSQSYLLFLKNTFFSNAYSPNSWRNHLLQHIGLSIPII